MKFAMLLTTLGVLLLGTPSVHAQQPITHIANLPVYCTAPNGVPVYQFFDPSLPDVGQAGYYGSTPTIRMNPQVLGQLPPIGQLFFYAHECGHHLSGDVIRGYTHGFTDPTVELRADMYGIRLVRDQLNPSLDQIQLLLQVIRANPNWDATHLPGPARAEWIGNCYQTNSPNCN